MADDHRLATTHLGRDLVRMIRGYPRWQDTDEGHEQFGLMLERVLWSAIAAADRYERNVEADAMARARKAANRTLAEIVKMTPALAKAPNAPAGSGGLEPFAHFARMWDANPVGGHKLSDDHVVYGIHTGTQWEAHLTLGHFRAALRAEAKSPRPACASDMLGNVSRTGEREEVKE